MLPPRLLFGLALWLISSSLAFAGMEIIAHRGANRLAPENTLAAQRLAYELGVDTVECDVRLSKDGVPVIMHDSEMFRTTGLPGYIGNYTLAQLKTFECGSTFAPEWAGEPIPTLAEMLAVAKQYNKRLLLDIKGQFIADPVVKAIRDSGIPLRQVPIFTWWKEMTLEYTSRLPGAEFLRNTVRPDLVTDADLFALHEQNVTTLLLLVDYVSPADIRRFHAAGFKVSLVIPPREYGFYYQDIGLDQFWTDFADITMASYSRQSQQWTNWAQSARLAGDQRRTWQDPDADGLNNLTEYAFGTDPLLPNSLPAPVMSADTIDWTVDLRENWSQFLTVTPQSCNVMDVWSGMSPAAASSTELSPARVLFKFPVNSSGKKFYRLRFDIKQ
ncbi:MAG TPA: glycerophosphodiester phosphodiesterase family protein [Verrucomicrobiales bacterium]|jgi:glycerophosphoryl diester phosphodiesterase|nr:glycerophosphodiester phosphodiesterase family protein [Verrucomicrobiales bacterium]